MSKPPPKHSGSVDQSRTIHAAIITLRVVVSWDFDRISRALGTPRSTCSGIVWRAKEATGNKDIIDLLDYTAKENNREACGVATTKIWPGSEASVCIQDAAWWFSRETWDEACRNHTPFGALSRKTIKRICHEHPHPLRDCPLTRVLEVQKPALSNSLHETYISAGGRPHKRRRVTVEQGQQTEERSAYADPIYFKIMQWGAICEAYLLTSKSSKRNDPA
ncbi:hypothetical protein EJ02DRAFT_515433 [Clathrospora elynae]|uniref:Uncharacterized protein n=1 Tax=Clathrospora elynae TaxID=706981 RepID=A0A6A5SBZ2_9PLEO|nr:hypothetical protein EJ02DRAFT_515433 [Clathrospora elynae]